MYVFFCSTSKIWLENLPDKEWTANSRIIGAQIHPNDSELLPSNSELVLRAPNLCRLKADVKPICLGLVMNSTAVDTESAEK